MLKKDRIKIYHLDMKYFSFFSFLKLIYLIRTIDPDIVQTWLIHGDLVGGFAAKLAGFKNIVWNVRYSNLEKKENFINILLIKILAFSSNFIPKKIIVVSKSAKINCKKFGYNKKNWF